MKASDIGRMAVKGRLGCWIGCSILAASLLLLGYAGQQVYAYASVSTDASADAAIVLGAAVWGGEPSPVFAERINHAVDLYHEGRVEAIVFTGGKGLGDEETEAAVAKAYAVRRGVQDADIHCETSSHVTVQNLRGARRVMAREGLTDALLVSDPLHMRRSMTMAEDLGLTVYPSPTPTSRYETWRTKLGFLLRESRLYASYLVRRGFMGR